MGRRRAWVLGLLHLVAFAHILYWQLQGRALSPLEPSESIEFILKGVFNAGSLIFLLSLLSVVIVGRFFCGWACHILALQDSCAWLLAKIGIKPRPFHSRFLRFVPIGAAIVMFGFALLQIVPQAWGPFETQFVRDDFWRHFPGWKMSLATFLLCGFGSVYFLGSKGFCRYACPYGALYAAFDRISLAKIRVNDSCAGCKVCTSVCSSQVDVAAEVAQFGMVVDQQCLKTLDCVKACPNDALSLTWGKPAPFFARAKGPRRAWRLSFGQEFLALFVFSWTLAISAGLPELLVPWGHSFLGQTPLLFALALSGCQAFLLTAAYSTLRSPSPEFKASVFTLRQKGRTTSSGRILICLATVALISLSYASWLQFHFWRADAATADVALSDYAWQRGNRSLPTRVSMQLKRAETELASYETLNPLDDMRAAARRGGIAMALGNTASALSHLKRASTIAPAHAATQIEIAQVLEWQGKLAAAEPYWQTALRLEPKNRLAKSRCREGYLRQADYPKALQLSFELLAVAPAELRYFEHWKISSTYALMKQEQKALLHLEELLALQPNFAPALRAKKTLQSRLKAPLDK